MKSKLIPPKLRTPTRPLPPLREPGSGFALGDGLTPLDAYARTRGEVLPDDPWSKRSANRVASRTGRAATSKNRRRYGFK